MTMARAKVYVKKAPKAKRESRGDRADRIRLDLVGAHAAIVTTNLVLQGHGVMNEVSTNLVRGALLPIEALMTEFDSVSRG
jgi:hypothetical protein